MVPSRRIIGRGTRCPSTSWLCLALVVAAQPSEVRCPLRVGATRLRQPRCRCDTGAAPAACWAWPTATTCRRTRGRSRCFGPCTKAPSLSPRLAWLVSFGGRRFSCLCSCSWSARACIGISVRPPDCALVHACSYPEMIPLPQSAMGRRAHVSLSINSHATHDVRPCPSSLLSWRPPALLLSLCILLCSRRSTARSSLGFSFGFSLWLAWSLRPGAHNLFSQYRMCSRPYRGLF